MFWDSPGAFCLSLSLLYVLPLYLLVPKEVQDLEYNNSVQIRYRMYVVSAATVFAVFLRKIVNTGIDEAPNVPKFEILIGLNGNLFSGMLISLLLMMIFYLGPIVLYLTMNIIKLRYRISDKGELTKLPNPMPEWKIISNIYEDVVDQVQSFTIREFRAIVFAPLTEEIVFRACMIPSYYIYYKYTLKDYSPWLLIYQVPLWFGVAHAHHLLTKLKGGEKMLIAIAQTLFQFAFTTIFGCIASCLFLRTGSILSPIISHMFCNYMGLPSVSFLFTGQSSISCLHPYRHVFFLLHALGLVLFAYAVIPCTESLQYRNIYWT